MAMEDYCIVAPRGREAGASSRQRPAVSQRQRSAPVAPQPQPDPDGCDVSRTLLQVLTQKRFGVRNAVLTQSGRGFEQARVLGGALDVPAYARQRRRIADAVRCPASASIPRQIGLSLRGANAAIARSPCPGAQCDTELVVHGSQSGAPR